MQSSGREHTHTDGCDGAAAGEGRRAKTAGERSTRQRSAIREAMQSEGRPMSPPEVLACAQRYAPKLGIATVYRNLKAMVEAGELTMVPLPGDRIYYELSHKATHHHHHFRCNQCEKVFDVEGCVETLTNMLPAGFVMTGHDITLYGLCEPCSRALAKSARKPESR